MPDDPKQDDEGYRKVPLNLYSGLRPNAEDETPAPQAIPAQTLAQMSQRSARKIQREQTLPRPADPFDLAGQRGDPPPRASDLPAIGAGTREAPRSQLPATLLWLAVTASFLATWWWFGTPSDDALSALPDTPTVAP